MAWLVSLLTYLGGQLVEFLSGTAVRRYVIMTVAAATMMTLFSAIRASFDYLSSQIVFVMPTEVYTALSQFAPSNLSTCVSLVISAWVLEWASGFKKYFLSTIVRYTS